MRDRITGARINRMSILLSILHIELPVIARGHHTMRSLRNAENRLQIFARIIVSIDGAVDADSPTVAGRIQTIAINLSDVHHHILHTD